MSFPPQSQISKSSHNKEFAQIILYHLSLPTKLLAAIRLIDHLRYCNSVYSCIHHKVWCLHRIKINKMSETIKFEKIRKKSNQRKTLYHGAMIGTGTAFFVWSVDKKNIWLSQNRLVNSQGLSTCQTFLIFPPNINKEVQTSTSNLSFWLKNRECICLGSKRISFGFDHMSWNLRPHYCRGVTCQKGSVWIQLLAGQKSCKREEYIHYLKARTTVLIQSSFMC